MPDKDFGCILSGPTGPIQLQTPGIYKLEKSTRGDRSISQRKITAKNPFVEGEFTVSAVRENVVETVAVFVYAPSKSVLDTRIKLVTDAFDQVSYSLAFRMEERTETWTCMAADYAVGTQHEFQHAYLALIKANVPRLPRVVLS